MKRKILIIISGVILILIILVLIFNKINKLEAPVCEMFTGGGFNVIYNTSGGNNIENDNICIACSPDSYESLPIPKKKGYKFDGWYYDEKLTNKVDGDSTLDIEPKLSKDKDGCPSGYEDITLYAKWK